MMKNNKEIITQCSKCQRTFIRQWVAPKGRYSQINSIDYWTDGKGWKNYEFLCRRCLKDWFEKDNESFVALVPSKRKKVFYTYNNSGYFDKVDNESFVNKWKKE